MKKKSKSSGERGISFDTVGRLARALPGVEESTSYGTRSLKVDRTLFARLREDGETLALNERSVVLLSLAPTNDAPGPRKAATDSTKKDSTKTPAKPAPKKASPPSKKAEKDTTPVDLTVELEDRDGVIARLPLSAFGIPRRPLDVHVLRRAAREKQNFRNLFELVPQTYVMPIADFQRAEPRFSASRLRAIRLVFDRLVAGTVIVDDVGVANPDPAFLAHAVMK